MKPLSASIATGTLLIAAACAAPSLSGAWLSDPRTGCRAWLPSALPDHAVRWAGACRTGVMDGPGTLEIDYKGTTTARYDGPMVDGRFEGRGVMTYVDGGRYDGDWQTGAKNGQGTELFADGARYDGGWKDNKASGSGVLVDRHGNHWAGTWLGGCLRRVGGRAMPPAVGIDTAGCSTR
jgi:hypothetical protein